MKSNKTYYGGNCCWGRHKKDVLPQDKNGKYFCGITYWSREKKEYHSLLGFRICKGEL